MESVSLEITKETFETKAFPGICSLVSDSLVEQGVGSHASEAQVSVSLLPKHECASVPWFPHF